MNTLHSQTKTTNKALGAGMIPLDLREPVRDVRFDEIISFLIDNFNDTIALTAFSNSFDSSAHDAVWDQKFARRMASMTVAERTLVTTAMIGHTQVEDFSMDDWVSWGDAQRAAAVTELVEKVTRFYVLNLLLTSAGPGLHAYRQVVIDMIQRTHFCS